MKKLKKAVAVVSAVGMIYSCAFSAAAGSTAATATISGGNSDAISSVSATPAGSAKEELIIGTVAVSKGNVYGNPVTWRASISGDLAFTDMNASASFGYGTSLYREDNIMKRTYFSNGKTLTTPITRKATVLTRYRIATTKIYY